MCKQVDVSFYAISRTPGSWNPEDPEVPTEAWMMEIFDNNVYNDMPTFNDPFWPDPNQSAEEAEFDRMLEDDDFIDSLLSAELLPPSPESNDSINDSFSSISDTSIIHVSSDEDEPPTARRRLNFDE